MKQLHNCSLQKGSCSLLPSCDLITKALFSPSVPGRNKFWICRVCSTLPRGLQEAICRYWTSRQPCQVLKSPPKGVDSHKGQGLCLRSWMKAKTREKLAAGWPWVEDQSSNGPWVNSKALQWDHEWWEPLLQHPVLEFVAGFAFRLCSPRYLAHSWTRIFSSSLFLQSLHFVASSTSSAEGWCEGAALCNACSRTGALLGDLSLVNAVPMSCPPSLAMLCDFMVAASGWTLCYMLAVLPDVVGMFGCLLQDAHHGTDLSNDKCSAAPEIDVS